MRLGTDGAAAIEAGGAIVRSAVGAQMASYPKHQMQGHPPTVQTRQLKDETQPFNAICQIYFSKKKTFKMLRVGVGYDISSVKVFKHSFSFGSGLRCRVRGRPRQWVRPLHQTGRYPDLRLAGLLPHGSRLSLFGPVDSFGRLGTTAGGKTPIGRSASKSSNHLLRTLDAFML